MAFARIQLPPEVKRGEVCEVRISIRHPMETGYRVDDLGKPIPRNTIRDLTCKLNGTLLLHANLGSGVSANPYLRFFIAATDSGDLLFEWVDDAGERGDAKATLKVVG
jgi:sulfur-oxidizing protein SoxZ